MSKRENITSCLSRYVPRCTHRRQKEVKALMYLKKIKLTGCRTGEGQNQGLSNKGTEIPQKPSREETQKCCEEGAEGETHLSATTWQTEEDTGATIRAGLKVEGRRKDRTGSDWKEYKLQIQNHNTWMWWTRGQSSVFKSWNMAGKMWISLDIHSPHKQQPQTGSIKPSPEERSSTSGLMHSC